MKKAVKTLALLIFIVFSLGFLSSCGTVSGSKKNETESAASAKPLHHHSEFVYDEDLTWDSSYTDIVKKYGKPDEEYNYKSDYVDNLTLVYNNPVVCGYTLERRMFEFDRKTGRLSCIEVESERYDTNALTSLEKKMSSDVFNALVSKYGQPVQEQYSLPNWSYVYAETRIVFTGIENSGKVDIIYRNDHQYSPEESYNDLPARTEPASESNPTEKPTANTQGI